MPLRMLSGRPRHLQLLVLSLIVLTVGVASGLQRSGNARGAGSGLGSPRRR